MTRRWVPFAALTMACSVLASGCGAGSIDDAALRKRFAFAGIQPISVDEQPGALVELGEALFFDKELSGNRDIACASCHHPALASGDALSLPIGTGGVGLGPDRILALDRDLVPRNSPEIFNRGSEHWETMFWDGRVMETSTGFVSPAGQALPESLSSVLAVQALFPPTSRDEMRGAVGDIAVDGGLNELALIDDGDFTGIWDAIMKRVLEIPEYVEMFGAAFPAVDTDDLGFEHAAEAIAAYEAQAFAFAASPFDRYLTGDDGALSLAENRGAEIFVETGCVMCHSGPLLTDQAYHTLGVPQIGPGKAPDTPNDLGRYLVTSDDSDLYAFRTPPLRNVALTGPWMHDGAYTELETVIRHHLDPVGTCEAYESGELGGLPAAVPADAALDLLDPALDALYVLSDEEIDDLVAFLGALTDPAAEDLDQLIPDSVPSGLPVDR
ncbi:MAG: c-type cytochrome [Acidimicrobiia bacterium]|nr:c-type cytochrome [Acidimicrobiia bacterium]